MIVRPLMKTLMQTGLALCAGLVISGTAQALEIVDIETESGVTAWAVEVPEIPLISIELAFEAGAATEPSEKAGLRLVLAEMMVEGAGDLDAQAFQTQMERLGINIQAAPQRDHFRVGMTTPSVHAAKAFELLNLTLTQLRVESNDLARVVAQSTASIRQSEVRPGSLAARRTMEMVFPDHPYGVSSSGTEAGLAAITPQDVRDYAATYLTTDGLQVALVGDMDTATAARYLDMAFAGLAATGPADRVAAPVTATITPDVILIDKDLPQASIRFALPAVTRDHPDWIPIVLISRHLGGSGLSSKLFVEVRRKRGLAYSVGMSPVSYQYAGLLMGATGTANETVWESIDVVTDVFRDIAENGMTAQELADIKSHVNGALPLSLNTNESLANMVLQMQTYNMGRDYMARRSDLINGVTMADIKRVAATYFDPAKLTFVVAGSPESR